MSAHYFIGQKFPLEPQRPAQVGEASAASWFGFQTPPLKETSAQAWLEKRGIEAWFPTEPRRRRLARGKRPFVEYDGKIVPRYVFARFTGWPQWDVLHGCRWLSRVIGLDGSPLPVSDDVMAQMEQVPQRLEVLRQREMERRRQEAQKLIIGPGDKVRINQGPMDGWIVDVSAVHAGIAKLILPQALLGMSETQVAVSRLHKIASD